MCLSLHKIFTHLWLNNDNKLKLVETEMVGQKINLFCLGMMAQLKYFILQLGGGGGGLLYSYT